MLRAGDHNSKFWTKALVGIFPKELELSVTSFELARVYLGIRLSGITRSASQTRTKCPLVWAPHSESLQTHYNTIINHLQIGAHSSKLVEEAKGPYKGPTSNPFNGSHVASRALDEPHRHMVLRGAVEPSSVSTIHQGLGQAILWLEKKR